MIKILCPRHKLTKRIRVASGLATKQTNMTPHQHLSGLSWPVHKRSNIHNTRHNLTWSNLLTHITPYIGTSQSFYEAVKWVNLQLVPVPGKSLFSFEYSLEATLKNSLIMKSSITTKNEPSKNNQTQSYLMVPNLDQYINLKLYSATTQTLSDSARIRDTVSHIQLRIWMKTLEYDS